MLERATSFRLISYWKRLNLDSKSGMEIIELLENLNQQGVTLMIITHDQAVGNRAQRQIRIVDGQIAQ